MKKIIILKWDALTVSAISILYGMQLVIFPYLLEGYKAYEVQNTLFNSNVFGFLFILGGVLEISSIIFNWPFLRALSISALIFMWTFFLVSFLLSPVVNSLWLLPLAMIMTSFGVVIKEWFH